MFELDIFANVVSGSGVLEPSLLVIVVIESGVLASAVFGPGVLTSVVSGSGVLGPSPLVIVVVRPSLLAVVVFGPGLLIVVVLRI
jgi:hypothetical protein